MTNLINMIAQTIPPDISAFNNLHVNEGTKKTKLKNRKGRKKINNKKIKRKKK